MHNGYHYPRSLLTALRCRINFPRFVDEYSECIVKDFDKYYAIGTTFSKVTAAQYVRFFERVGSPLGPAPKEVKRLFNRDLIEDVFAATEYVFDAVKLAQIMRRRLAEAEVEVRFSTEAQKVRQVEGSLLEVTCASPNGTCTVTAPSVLNCTYSRLNQLLVASGLPKLFLKYELSECAFIEPPDELKHLGITVMCGPFFSIMPFPPLHLHNINHVRYSPHCEWWDKADVTYRDPYEYCRVARKKSNHVHMTKDIARYIPCMSTCRYVDSIWDIKVVLPKSEVDDSRPVLYRKDCGLPNLTCLMGGKIDNVYDIIEYENASYARGTA